LDETQLTPQYVCYLLFTHECCEQKIKVLNEYGVYGIDSAFQ